MTAPWDGETFYGIPVVRDARMPDDGSWIVLPRRPTLPDTFEPSPMIFSPTTARALGIPVNPARPAPALVSFLLRAPA